MGLLPSRGSGGIWRDQLSWLREVWANTERHRQLHFHTAPWGIHTKTTLIHAMSKCDTHEAYESHSPIRTSNSHPLKPSRHATLNWPRPVAGSEGSKFRKNLHLHISLWSACLNGGANAMQWRGLPEDQAQSRALLNPPRSPIPPIPVAQLGCKTSTRPLTTATSTERRSPRVRLDSPRFDAGSSQSAPPNHPQHQVAATSARFIVAQHPPRYSSTFAPSNAGRAADTAFHSRTLNFHVHRRLTGRREFQMCGSAGRLIRNGIEFKNSTCALKSGFDGLDSWRLDRNVNLHRTAHNSAVHLRKSGSKASTKRLIVGCPSNQGWSVLHSPRFKQRFSDQKLENGDIVFVDVLAFTRPGPRIHLVDRAWYLAPTSSGGFINLVSHGSTPKRFAITISWNFDIGRQPWGDTFSHGIKTLGSSSSTRETGSICESLKLSNRAWVADHD